MTRAVSITRFSLLFLRSGIRDIKSQAISFGLPLFMLFTFWITTRDGSEESTELFLHMIPAICAMAVMMPAQTQATRLVSWRECGSLRRLALSPIPASITVIGISVSQIIIGLIQGLIICFCCLIAAKQQVQPEMFFIIIADMVVISSAFISLGILLSVFFKKASITGYAFFAVFLPMFFIGSFPLEQLPRKIHSFIPWLPTSMGINLINSIFEHTKIQKEMFFPVFGLLAYTLVFITTSSLLYKNKEL